MIPTLDQSRADRTVADIIKQSAAVLHPKLKRLLNPNVVDSWIKLDLHMQNGALSHIRCASSEPAYALGLNEHAGEAFDAQFKKLFADCLKVVRQLLSDHLPHGCHGVLGLQIAISGGVATITSVVDVVTKAGGK